MILIHDDVFVYFMPMPPSVRELVTENEDGTFSIFINENLSEEKRIAAYRHGMKHIKNNDFQKDDVQAIEYAAHQDNTEKAEVLTARKYEQRIRRLRAEIRSTKRKLEETERGLTIIREGSGEDNYFSMLENQWLYGRDL